jgi:hypothetical protein
MVRLVPVQSRVSTSSSAKSVQGKEPSRLNEEVSFLVNSLRKEIHQLQSTLADSMTKTLLQEVTDTIRHELRLEPSLEKVDTKRSYPTHVVEADLRLLLEKLINQTKYEEAFTKALSSGNLKLVIHLCSKVDPREVLSANGNVEPLPLSQPVILSLVQQLSHDMPDNTDLKLQWIQESLLALDNRNPVIAEHLPRVLHQVVQTLETLTQTASPALAPSLIRQNKLVLHLAKSLLKD